MSSVELGYNTREWQMASVGYSFGRSFNSRFQLWEAGFNRKLGDKLSLEYDLNRLFLDPDPDKKTTWIHILRLDYFFNKDLFLKLFFQLNSALAKKNIQLVFVWRFQPPFGILQLAYQQGVAALRRTRRHEACHLFEVGPGDLSTGPSCQ